MIVPSKSVKKINLLQSVNQFEVSQCNGTAYLGVRLHGRKLCGSILDTHLVCSEMCMYAKRTAREDMVEKLLMEGRAVTP